MKTDVYPITSAQPHRVALISRPRGGDWLPDEIGTLLHQGFQVIVSMLTDAEASELGLLEERQECLQRHIAFEQVPIPDRAVPSDRDAFLSAVEHIAEQVRAGMSVGVHCRAGIGRSSMFLASVLVRLGWGVEESFLAIQEARGCPVPDTPDQRKWVQLQVERGRTKSAHLREALLSPIDGG